MAENFEFREPQISLMLCGRKFSVTVGEITAEICSDILEEAKSRLAQIKNGDNSKQLSEAGICTFLKGGIERLLGEGAVDKVFGDRKQNVSDMAELMCYIVTKIKTAYLKR